MNVRVFNEGLEFNLRAKSYRIGLIALSTDHTSEPDFSAMTRSVDAGIYVSRVEQINPNTIENLRLMAPKNPRCGGAYSKRRACGCDRL